MWLRASMWGWLLVLGAASAVGEPLPETKSYPDPTIKGVRLDWCRNAGQECGKPAADLFCREQGFEAAARFVRDPTIGARGVATLIFGDGRTCQGAACSGFRSITCARKASPAKPTVPAQAGSQSEQAGSSAVAVPKPPPPSLPALRKLREPVEARGVIKPVAPLLPAGAQLYYCSGGSCEFQLTNDIDIDPKVPGAGQWFYWDVAKIAVAAAVRWQVASTPFSGDFEPAGLLGSGEGTGKNGSFKINFNKLTFSSPAAPDILYVRILPLAQIGASTPVGQPSNIVRALYAAKAASPSGSPFIGMEVTAFKLELVSFEYRPYQLIQRWPPGCKDIPRDEGRSGLDAVAYAVEEVWNFASETYQWVKSRAVDLASALTAGLIPRQYLAVALDGALVAVGIPPDVPNIGEMMRNGIDGLAKEMAKGVVAQLPAGELAPTLGNLAGDVVVSQAEKMATDELKRRVEREIEKRSRDVLLRAAAEVDAQIASEGTNMYCRVKVIPPTYRGVVKNAHGSQAEDMKLVVSDSGNLFQSGSLRLDIAPGGTASWSFVPKPLIRVVQRSQLRDKDIAANEQHWWNELYPNVPTRLSVSGISQRQCPAGAQNRSLCQESMQILHQSPGNRLLTSSYAFPK